MLSTPEFAAFAKKVVPFLHVTTRIDGRAHDNLLSEKGFRGFPSLAFMDAEGEVIAQPQDRSTAGFSASLDALVSLQDLTKRAEAGEEGLDADILFAEQALGKVTATEFETRAKALEGLSAEQQAKVDQILLDNEVMTLGGAARYGGENMTKAATRFLEMLSTKKMPSAKPQLRGMFWQTLANHAQKEGDTKLLRQSATGIKADLKDNPNAAKFADNLAKTADQLDRHAELEKKIAGGEEGLEAELLVVAYDLGKIKGEPFVEKATGLLDKADATQKAALEERILGSKIATHLSGARSPAGAEAAAKGILELLGENGNPPEAVAPRVWQFLMGYAKQTGDADLMERALPGIEKAFKGNPSLAGFVKKTKEDIQAIRDAKKKEADEADGDEGADEMDGDGEGK